MVVLTDDDTKFERARREAPTKWTAAIVPGAPVTPRGGPEAQVVRVDFAEVLARWAAVDELRGSRNDEGPHRER